MNTRLVDSLVQIIESLNPEKRILLQERLSGKPIQVTVGVRGRQPRIVHTRIAVWTMVSFHQLGADDEELLRNYPTLTREDLKSAWAYYEQHRSECDRAIADFEQDDPKASSQTFIIQLIPQVKMSGFIFSFCQRYLTSVAMHFLPSIVQLIRAKCQRLEEDHLHYPKQQF